MNESAPSNDRRALWRSCAVVGLTLLAPLLGGSTELWAQIILVLLTGALLIILPPRETAGRWPTILFIAAGLIALVAFLPAAWFPLPPWRSALTNLGVELPATRSPQPWLTLESVLLLWLGLAWAYYLFAIRWAFRETIWDTFCFGILGLAAMLAVAFAMKVRVPFWPDAPEFGFFPNRNQTGNVLGLGGILIYANAFQHLQRGKKSGWLWLASLALIGWALILNYSRGGIIVFFAGTFLWNLWWWRRGRDRSTGALAFAPLVLLVLLLVIAGGETFLRFTKSADILAPAASGRGLIARDAWQLFQESPLFGTGLGNFRALFSSHRNFSFSSSEAIHPESDWLWLAVESGVVGPFLLLALVAWWIRHCFPFDRGSWRQMRMAALIGGCAFIGHGLFDVSGHRFGSLWPALFCAATALHPRERTGRSRLLANIFRGLGLSFLGVGIWWSLSLTGYIDSANSATLRGLLVRADQASEHENYQEMRTLLNRAFPIAPIYWELYFKRGVAEAGLYEPRTLVERDFAIARHLYPFWAELYLKEGQVWLAVGEPDLAFDLWQHGLAPLRAEGPRLYEQIFSVVKESPDLVDRWRDLGHNDKQCRIIMLRSVDPMGFRIELNRLLEEDPQLNGFSADERRMIFDTWYQKGDKLALAETLRAHPDWEKIGWRKLALIFADYQDYRQAFETTRRFIAPPRTVDSGSETVETLQSRFRLNVTPATGLALARAEIRDGRVDDALETLKVVAGLPDHPREILWLESELWARKGSWPQAWRAIFEYDNARR